MTRLATSLAVLATSLTVLAAPAAVRAQVKPEDAIRARQSIMRVVGLSFGPIGKMAAGEAPMNKEMFQAHATRIESVWSLDPAKFFVPGSDKPVQGSKIASFTAAKPEIWSQQDKFKAAYERASKNVAALAQAARSGDEGAMKAAAGELGKSCKACHDDFQAK